MNDNYDLYRHSYHWVASISINKVLRLAMITYFVVYWFILRLLSFNNFVCKIKIKLWTLLKEVSEYLYIIFVYDIIYIS